MYLVLSSDARSGKKDWGVNVFEVLEQKFSVEWRPWREKSKMYEAEALTHLLFPVIS
jgi:hypothetical protein